MAGGLWPAAEARFVRRRQCGGTMVDEHQVRGQQNERAAYFTSAAALAFGIYLIVLYPVRWWGGALVIVLGAMPILRLLLRRQRRRREP